MNFSPTVKTYHLPDSGGSYISRYQSISSHIRLTLNLDESIEYYSIYFTTILLDFMAYSSQIGCKCKIANRFGRSTLRCNKALQTCYKSAQIHIPAT